MEEFGLSGRTFLHLQPLNRLWWLLFVVCILFAWPGPGCLLSCLIVILAISSHVGHLISLPPSTSPPGSVFHAQGLAWSNSCFAAVVCGISEGVSYPLCCPLPWHLLWPQEWLGPDRNLAEDLKVSYSLFMVSTSRFPLFCPLPRWADRGLTIASRPLIGWEILSCHWPLFWVARFTLGRKKFLLARTD